VKKTYTVFKIKFLAKHRAYMYISYRKTHLHIPFFNGGATSQTGGRIFTHDGSNDAVSRKGVPFRGRKFKAII